MPEAENSVLRGIPGEVAHGIVEYEYGIMDGVKLSVELKGMTADLAARWLRAFSDEDSYIVRRQVGPWERINVL